jgi:two-component system, OmpR family, response regulator VicR
MLNLSTDLQQEQAIIGLDLDEIQSRTSTKRALIIDDDPDSVDLIKLIIRNAGMDVFGAFNGSEALQKCTNLHPNIILLDLMMPGMDGWETYERIRKITDVPVIVVSAITKKEQVVKGLQMGFDDYVTKPFFPPELVARVKTVLRRAGEPKPVTTRVFPEADLSIDSETRDVILRGQVISLTSREFAVLEMLARKAPKMVRYEEIAGEIWNGDGAKVRNRIKYLIYLLRHKLETDPNNPQLILNREGLGYMLNIEPA